MKTRRAPYHYVEVMACPSGCINGGGQIKPPESIPAKEWITRVDAVYRSLSSQPPEHNSTVLDIYRQVV
jgi:iron only hydrogenase large subunit-like protein